MFSNVQRLVTGDGIEWERSASHWSTKQVTYVELYMNGHSDRTLSKIRHFPGLLGL